MILPASSYLPVPKSVFIDHFMCGLLISLLLASKVQFTFDTKPFRSIGIWIYFTHMYVVFFIKKFLGVSGFADNIICVLPISICIAVILHYLSQRYDRIKTLICA